MHKKGGEGRNEAGSTFSMAARTLAFCSNLHCAIVAAETKDEAAFQPSSYNKQTNAHKRGGKGKNIAI